MSNLMEILQSQLGGALIPELSKQVNAPEDQTSAATNGILSTLIGALSKNASTPEGAASLNNALEQDHDGGILDNIMGLLGGDDGGNQKASNGAGIIGHIFGDKVGGVVEGLSKSTGMDTSSIGMMLIKLAPVVMGALGKVKSQQGLDQNGLSDLLQGTVSDNSDQNPLLAMAGRFLDKDQLWMILEIWVWAFWAVFLKNKKYLYRRAGRITAIIVVILPALLFYNQSPQ